MDHVSSPAQGPQANETGQVVIEHGLRILEPLQLGSCLVVVECAQR